MRHIPAAGACTRAMLTVATVGTDVAQVAAPRRPVRRGAERVDEEPVEPVDDELRIGRPGNAARPWHARRWYQIVEPVQRPGDLLHGLRSRDGAPGVGERRCGGLRSADPRERRAGRRYLAGGFLRHGGRQSAHQERFAGQLQRGTHRAVTIGDGQEDPAGGPPRRAQRGELAGEQHGIPAVHPMRDRPEVGRGVVQPRVHT
jgi:hypothetical protein